MAFPSNIQSQRTWQLDPILLTHNPFFKFIWEQINTYIEINSTPDISYTVTWESPKAYLRGQVISNAAYEKKKTKSRHLTELAEQIQKIDGKLPCESTPDMFKARLLLQTEYYSLLAEKAERLLLKSKQHTLSMVRNLANSWDRQLHTELSQKSAPQQAQYLQTSKILTIS